MITCPHCGKPMPEEALFCESCGKERQLVPDYEAEVNQSMDETISTIAVELANTQEIVPQDLVRDAVIREKLNIDENGVPRKSTEKKPEGADEAKARKTKKDKNGLNGEEKPNRLLPLILLIGSILIVLAASLVLALILHQDNDTSYEYQLQQALVAEQAGDYEQMLTCARKASELATNSSDAKMMVARAYAGLGRTSEQKIVLEGLIITDPAYIAAYYTLIPIYENEKDYQKIAALLQSCPEQSVIEKYADYIASEPEFSVKGGDYSEMISVKLLATGSGKIYYTVDGSKPGTDSSVYSMPIILEDGDYRIRAIYENSYGIVSQEKEERYHIKTESELPSPVILLESGSYQEPQVISVEKPEDGWQVYYTDDGSEPGLESRSYSKPIPLPLGESQYRFVLINEEGIKGQEAVGRYVLSIPLPLTVDQANNLLMQALVGAGILLDSQGQIPGGEGIRTYKAISIISGSEGYYYLMEEYFKSNEGSSQRTGTFYAVSVTTGQSYLATQGGDGSFLMNPL